MDDLPSTGHGLQPPTQETMPGRLLAVEVRAHNNAKRITAMESLLGRFTLAVVAASLGVMVTVIGAAVYVGGRFQAVTDLDRRIAHLEDRP
jgi:uncharacterized membrane protein HdeD (DUF308 family)